MKLMTGCMAALTAAMLLAFAPPARAGDTMRLGVGSLTGASATYAAPTVTLKGNPEDKAETQDVIFRPYARGYYHGSLGYGYRPWVGFYRPWVGFYRPWVGFYRPYAFYRPYYYGYYPGISFGFSSYSYGSYYPISTSVAVTVPTILDTGAANPYYGSVPQTYTPPLAAPMGPSGETLPTPRPIDTFRYDGGPAVPVPMPDGARPMPMTQPGSPLNTAAVNRVKASPAKKITYPAYGEELPPPRPATTNPILVKKPGQK